MLLVAITRNIIMYIHNEHRLINSCHFVSLNRLRFIIIVVMFPGEDVGDIFHRLVRGLSTSREKDNDPHDGHDEQDHEESKTEPRARL